MSIKIAVFIYLRDLCNFKIISSTTYKEVHKKVQATAFNLWVFHLELTSVTGEIIIFRTSDKIKFWENIHPPLPLYIKQVSNVLTSRKTVQKQICITIIMLFILPYFLEI